MDTISYRIGISELTATVECSGNTISITTEAAQQVEPDSQLCLEAEYRDMQYRVYYVDDDRELGDYNAAWEALVTVLPAGEIGDTIYLSAHGVHGGTLQYEQHYGETSWEFGQ